MTTTSLSPSKIGKLQEVFGAALRKADPPDEEVQDLIENHWEELRPELEAAFTAAVNKVLKRNRNTFTVIAKRVDYTRTPQQVIRATGRAEHLDEGIVATMPRCGEGVVENVKVTFFKLGRFVNAEELDREYEQHGLVPDPYAQAAVNEQDSAFADQRPNGSQWGRSGKIASYLAFDRWRDERHVSCGRRDDGWDDDWWFAGVRK